jgi:hypothetical protein
VLLALMWLAIVSAAGCVAVGVISLIRPRRVKVSPWFQILLGAAILLNAIPRVAGADGNLILVLSFVSLGLTAVAVGQLIRGARA